MCFFLKVALVCADASAGGGAGAGAGAGANACFNATPPQKSRPVYPFQEVVRNKDARAAMFGHDCEQCRKFYAAANLGGGSSVVVQRCSRHRSYNKVPPSTPDGYWDINFPDSEPERESRR